MVDKRDNMVFATDGYFLKLAQVCLLLCSMSNKSSQKWKHSQSIQVIIWRKLISQLWPFFVTQCYVTWRDEGKETGLSLLLLKTTI